MWVGPTWRPATVFSNEADEAEHAAAVEYSAAKGHLIITAPVVFGRLRVLPVATAVLSREGLSYTPQNGLLNP